MSQNVIELNGKRYDAITGALLGAGSPTAAIAALPHRSPGRAVDGFIRRTGIKPAVPHAASAKSAPIKAAATHQTANKSQTPTAPLHHAGHVHVHVPAKPVERHRPERAKTLMRRAVPKPAFTLKPAIKPQVPAEVMARPASAIARKHSVVHVDPGRLERAKSIVKHNAVRRFQLPRTGREPVVRAVHPVGGHVPVIAVRPQPLTPQLRSRPAQRPDIFEAAIARAKSHEQPLQKRRPHRRRLTNVLAVAAVFVVLGSFIAYLNLPNIQLHIASVEAGFRASMPSYHPTGYALRGGIHHQGGTISMRFTSGDSSYQVTEQSSNWDSQGLLDNTLALAGPHKTIEKNGRIIYVYGDGANATWVTGNVRYDITGNASLSADELATIAASI